MEGMTMEGGWRMVPMDMSMPMLPGLEGTVPIVGPFMPGMGMDAAMLPEARPSEVVVMADADTLDISVSMVRRTIDGHEMIMFGYNGQYPGPLIQAPQDATLIIRVTNNIEMPTTIHWHGLRLDNRFDGVPGVTQEAIETAESFTYEVHVPDAGMFWYHPHVREDVQQDLGLFGNLLVTSPDPEYYGPAHREEVFVLDDMLIDDQGALPWGDRAPTHALMGRFGNVMMVNGETDYRLTAQKGEVIRFYLTNVANSRTFNVTFGGARVKIVASDVGRFEREQWVGSVVIAPAERYVVDVRFEEPGEVAISNTVQAINHFRGVFFPKVDTLSLVTVTEDAADSDISSAFETLRENADVIADIDAFRGEFDRAPDYSRLAPVNHPLHGVRHALRATHGVERCDADDELALDCRTGDLDSEGSTNRRREWRHRLELHSWRCDQGAHLQYSGFVSPDESSNPRSWATFLGPFDGWRRKYEPRLEGHSRRPRRLDHGDAHRNVEPRRVDGPLSYRRASTRRHDVQLHSGRRGLMSDLVGGEPR
jgi:FtsP/CotA-like multicopper oxidase with cupredoxin domain